jgi:hypothetical protein
MTIQGSGVRVELLEVEPQVLLDSGLERTETERPLDAGAREHWRARLSALAPGRARGVLAMRSGRPVAQALAAATPGLRDEHGEPVGCIGLFDARDGEPDAAAVLESAARWLRGAHGLRRVFGPLDLDIWEGYRLLTRGFEREAFPGEPRNPARFPAAFADAGFTVLRRWTSIEMGPPALETLLASSLPGAACAAAAGLRFVAFDGIGFDHLAKRLRELLRASLASFPAFTPPTVADVDVLATRLRPALHGDASFVMLDADGRDVGFAMVLQDPLAAARGVRRLVLHTGAVRPSVRGLGLGLAGFHEALRRMRIASPQQVIIALVAEDSPARRLLGPIAGSATREYALFERRLP